jgi:lactate dehydrogenase-like 2-hydroxyacid dehydrogenase
MLYVDTNGMVFQTGWNGIPFVPLSVEVKMTVLDGKTIAIVGGGPGGLTLARLLQQGGAKVTVYERDHSRRARVQGSALDLHEDSGLAALDARPEPSPAHRCQGSDSL